MSQTNSAIVRGERRAQAIRPATLYYAGAEMPCTPGNDLFFQKLTPAGFQPHENLFVKIIRADIPPVMLDKEKCFQSGQTVQVKNTDPESPGCGEIFDLTIGDENSWQSQLVLLNLTKQLV